MESKKVGTRLKTFFDGWEYGQNYRISERGNLVYFIPGSKGMDFGYRVRSNAYFLKDQSFSKNCLLVGTNIFTRESILKAIFDDLLELSKCKQF